jgi:hypothetical protein
VHSKSPYNLSGDALNSSKLYCPGSLAAKLSILPISFSDAAHKDTKSLSRQVEYWMKSSDEITSALTGDQESPTNLYDPGKLGLIGAWQ